MPIHFSYARHKGDIIEMIQNDIVLGTFETLLFTVTRGRIPICTVGRTLPRPMLGYAGSIVADTDISFNGAPDIRIITKDQGRLTLKEVEVLVSGENIYRIEGGVNHTFIAKGTVHE